VAAKEQGVGGRGKGLWKNGVISGEQTSFNEMWGDRMGGGVSHGLWGKNQKKITWEGARRNELEKRRTHPYKEVGTGAKRCKYSSCLLEKRPPPTGNLKKRKGRNSAGVISLARTHLEVTPEASIIF